MGTDVKILLPILSCMWRLHAKAASGQTVSITHPYIALDRNSCFIHNPIIEGNK